MNGQQRVTVALTGALCTVVAAAQSDRVPTPQLLSPEVILDRSPYPESVSDAVAYAKWLDDRLAGLTQWVDRASDKSGRAVRKLVLANWLLAVRCEPDVSRRLLRVDRGADLASVRAWSNQALALVAEARAQLAEQDADGADDADLETRDGAPPAKAAPEPGTKPEPNGQPSVQVDPEGEPDAEAKHPAEPKADGRSDTPTEQEPEGEATSAADATVSTDQVVDGRLSDSWRTTDEALDIVNAFAIALHAFATEADDPQREQRLRLATRKLAVFLEDERPTVARAALLWRSVIYVERGRVDRALRILPGPFDARASEALRYGLFARLLRCRLLARQGSFAAAWSHLIDLEARVVDWFSEVRDRTNAQRIVCLFQLEVCAMWSGVDTPYAQATQMWCRSNGRRIRGDCFSDHGPATVLRLQHAVPLLFQPPDDPAGSTDEPPMPAVDEAPGH